MLKRYSVILLVLVLAVSLAIGCAKPAPAPAPAPPPAPKPAPAPAPKPAAEPEMIPGVKMPDSLKIKGLTSKGSPYEFEAESYIINIEKMFPGIACRQIPGGSKEGAIWVNDGSVDMSLGAGLTVYATWFGSQPVGSLVGYTEDMRKANTISAWGPCTEDCFVALASSDIHSLKDLWDKQIYAGPPGSSGPMFANPAAFALHGITYDTIKENGGFVTFGKETDAIDMMKAGRLDALWNMGANPYGPLMELNMTKPLRFIPYTEEELAAACDPLKGDDIWERAIIPANTYKGQTEDILSIGYKACVIASTDIPDDVIYNFLWAQWCGGRWEILQDMHPSFKNIDFLENATMWAQLPWHPGAVKFWTDFGRELPKSTVETVDPQKLYEARKKD